MITSKEQNVQEEFYQRNSHWVWKSYWTDAETYQFYLSLSGELMGKYVLEAGCGDGRFTFELLKAGARVAACDYSFRALTICKVMNPLADVFLTDLKGLSCKNEMFDIIYLIETIEHIEPYLANEVIDNLYHSLKKKGIIIVTTPSNCEPIHPHHFLHYSPDELLCLFSKKFEIIKKLGRLNSNLIVRAIHKIVNNKFFDIKKLSTYLRKHIYLNCSYRNGKQLVIVGQKNGENQNRPA